MPRSDYKTCRQCGRHSTECGPISHARLCLDCGIANQTNALFGIAEGVGPAAERRLRRYIMWAHRELLAMQGDKP